MGKVPEASNNFFVNLLLDRKPKERLIRTPPRSSPLYKGEVAEV